MLGEEFVALATKRNEANKIYAGAICLVRHVDQIAVSIAVTGNNRGSFPNRVVPKDIFGSNFEPRKGGSTYRGIAPGRHFTEKYI
ncbi:hypothetical protein [Erythrobacter donghaensis]|uniref:hypothetical protein n=1 Tax=Erythrobacter donghaensis TaxID=267135 RepID=UPI000A36214C|nr:hypothetical protein [Erythrobacter donghaensis]